nr:DUF1576 domain-containing protein [Sedimentibacter sp.]
MLEPERRDVEIKIGRLGNLEILLILPFIMLIMAFILDSPSVVAHGLYKMIISPDVLLTDYLEIGGIGATFLNASLLAFINIFIIYKLKLKINGALIAAIFTIIGFSFLGKNLFNVWPMYLGGYLYVKYHKIEFKNILVIIMFSTALAPVTSELAFGLNTSLWIRLPIGIIFGVFCGFIITPLSSHMNRLHDGYNLYNIGFTAGLLGTLINSLLKSFGVNIKQQQILSTEYDLILKIFLIFFFITLIIIGFIINRKSFKGYTKILNFSGRLVSDYTQLVGYGLTFVNMGLMGFVSMLYIIVLKGTFNGPIVGAIFTIVGFSAFGKHPRNTIPIMIGVFISGILTIFDTQSTIVIMAGLFGTTLAPLAGKYGFCVGLLAGFMHLTMVMNVGIIHSGINLYNNGFSGGLVAAILFPLLNSIKKGD